MCKVIKRDGRIVNFDASKIENAVLKAFNEVDGETTDFAKEKASNIADYIKEKANEFDQNMDIEQIQDLVENGLMSTKRKDVARAYINYRHDRAIERERKGNLYKTVTEKLLATNVKNQNANVNEYSFGGRKGEAGSAMMKKYALDYLISPKAVYNHTHNIVYIHDLDSYFVGQHNCESIPFDRLLEEGFIVQNTDVRPPRSIATAMQLVAVIFQLQSLDQFGGVSATHLDWTMVPYIRMSFCKHYKDGLKYIATPQAGFKDGEIKLALDIEEARNISIEDRNIYKYESAYQYAKDMTVRETYQAVEAMYHNLNTLQSRSGNQLPFTSINYGTCTLPEGRLAIKALLEQCIKGVGKLHRTSVFPCGIFQSSAKWNRYPGTPNYDLYQLALKCTAKRLYPNYANIDWSGNAGYDENDPKTFFSTMGCRTANGYDINHEPGVNPQTKDGRGNICPNTIVLPTLAMMAKEKSEDDGSNIVEDFMQILDDTIGDAKDELIERFDWVCSQDAKSGPFMYTNHTMEWYKPEEGIRSALKHGTLAMGQVGLAECLRILLNGKDQTTDEGMALAKRIEQLFKNRCAEYKEKYKLNFGVYYSPAENMCYTSMQKFKEKYGIIPGVSDKDYFTNSMHVSVWKKMSPFEKIDIESQLTGYSSAGCITYVELDYNCINNLKALEQIVNYAMEHDIPYFAINVPNDTCLECGYTGEFNDACPVCGSHKIQQLRRVTGYLSTDWRRFNKGKQEEVKDRVKHMRFDA